MLNLAKLYGRGEVLAAIRQALEGWNSGILTGYSPTIQSTNGGSITITGITGQTGGTNSSYGIDINNGSYPGDPSIGGTSQSGAITYIADSANWGSSTHYYTTQTTGNVTFKNYTSGSSIGVGSGSGTLNIPDTLLNSYLTLGSSSVLTFGGSTAGATTINSAHTYTTGTTFQTGTSGSDITLSGNLSFTPSTTGDTLTFSSYRNIIIDNSITASSNPLNMLFDADNGGNSYGAIWITANVTSNNGNITMGGGNGTISAGSGYAWGTSTTGGQGVTFRDSTVSAGTGNIIVNGKGYATDTNSSDTDLGIVLEDVATITTLVETTSGVVAYSVRSIRQPDKECGEPITKKGGGGAMRDSGLDSQRRSAVRQRQNFVEDRWR